MATEQQQYQSAKPGEIPAAPKVGSGAEIPLPPPPPPSQKHLLMTQRVMAPLSVDVSARARESNGGDTSSF
jgi:hypothetical protein